MTAQILASELSNLIQDSKRKNTELRNAAEKALQDLKALPVTSEAQLTADLSRRPHFISPFLIACGTQTAKFASVGVSCLQRLAVSRALPKERLTEVLDAFRGCVALGADVQLKILQALPPLLQNYPTELAGELLSTILQICSALQNAKNPAVSNTATATLQQLVIFVFDKVSSEDENSLQIPTVAEVPGDGDPVAVRPAAHDAYKVFHDLNLIINAEKPVYIRFSPIPQACGLELVEAVLSNHRKIISSHPEQTKILRTLLMPMIIRSLSDRLSFPLTLRIIRIVYLLIRNHLSAMPSELEISLGLLNHMLDPEASTVWKRALCLEVFRGIYSDHRLVLEIYGQFDAREGKRCVLGDNLASFVRLATEKPAIIGLGSHSTMPATAENKDTASEQAFAEAGALAGVIGGPVSDLHHTGISTQWSSVKTPCMEQLDKAEAPSLPETYIYGLVLTCITNLSESLGKFILALTVNYDNKGKKRGKGDVQGEQDESQNSPGAGGQRPHRTQSFRKKSVPVNPISLTEHPSHKHVKAASDLIEECWPAVLATCSTFLNAALDTDYYRGLVRAIQRLTQVAGLLRLSTPRDAFLTTLGKAAVPPLALANISSPKTPNAEQSGMFSNAKGLLSVESLVSHASSMSLEKPRQVSHENHPPPTLSPRNLLCLRALLNLAIALGPTLQSAWSIIFEALQIADTILAIAKPHGSRQESRTPGSQSSRQDGEQSAEKIEAETAAVEAAARRLFESSVDFPDESFIEMLQALCTLLHPPSGMDSVAQTPDLSGRPSMHQRRMGSISGISLNTGVGARDSLFALNEIGEIVALNRRRLATQDAAESGWNILVSELIDCSADDHKTVSARIRAADILARTAIGIAELSRGEEDNIQMQERILAALYSLILVFHEGDAAHINAVDETHIKIQQIAIEALKSVIEQCGESLAAGWDTVFASLSTVFSSPRAVAEDSQGRETGESSTEPTHVVSKQLARSAFGSIQLVCSDFLAAVPLSSLKTLLELLLAFCSQQDDLNMSLTTITFFWNVSDFLHTCGGLASDPEMDNAARDQTTTKDLAELYPHQDSAPRLWLQVLLDLSIVTTDPRAELRNSAIQTVQRIFENYGDQLTPNVWLLCLRSILFKMVESNLEAQTTLRRISNPPRDEVTAWEETTRTVLDSVSNLFSTYIYKVDNPSKLGASWKELLVYLEKYFEFGSFTLDRSVFDALTAVISRINNVRVFGAEPVVDTALVWRSYSKYRLEGDDDQEGNQDAFVAYAEAFKAIFRLGEELLPVYINTMVPNLLVCVAKSDEAAYSSDVDHMTTFQTRVMECLSMVQYTQSGILAFMIRMISGLCVLPYTAASNPKKKRPTFVALSKASMSLLQSVTVKHIGDSDIYERGAFCFALSSLVRPVQEKYVWKQEGKPPTLWQKATNTALAILEPGLSFLETQDFSNDVVKDLWDQIVNLAAGITGARVSPLDPPSSLETDENFDIDAFTRLRSMIGTSLGSASLPDSMRRTYTRNLFQTSLIHRPETGEVPDVSSAPLEDLYKVRRGRTRDTTPTPRIRMAYACFSELIALVSVKSGSGEEIKLSQAAAPYLILRVALTLKGYIADQPLRGRMPAPDTHRAELMFALEQMKRLDSEPQAIPNAPGATSRHKKHLHRIYLLVVEAIGVAKYDDSVMEELRALMGIVGGEFGLDPE